MSHCTTTEPALANRGRRKPILFAIASWILAVLGLLAASLPDYHRDSPRA
jgi:hypothetical protein